MRVLHLLKTSTGATWALRQMRELVNLGIEVHVALPPDGPLVSAYTAAGITVHFGQFDFPTRHPEQILPQLKALRHLVAQVKPDLIHSHFVGTTLTMRLALGLDCPIPRVFQVPGPLHLEHNFYRWGELALAGPQDYWIGSCQWTCKHYFQAGIPANRVFLSYYGTDLAHFGPKAPGKLREELAIGPETVLIGMVAFMYAPKWFLGQRRGLKGHEDLIDAVAICQAKGLDVRVVFIGGAWNGATNYEAQVRAYGEKRCGKRAFFLGTRSDVSQLYSDFTLAIHPSHSENVGGAVESLLFAIPTIATNVGGFPDLILPGETGWLVPPHKPHHLAAAIMEAVQNPGLATQKALKGQKLARELFDLRKTAQQVASIYTDILQIRS